MVLNDWHIELRRTGETAKLLVQSRPIGLETAITLEQLERFALFLAHEVGLWRDDHIEVEAVCATTEGGSSSSSQPNKGECHGYKSGN